MTPFSDPTASTFDLLGHVPLFRDLDPADREEIAAAVRAESFDEGAVVFHIGEPGRSIHVVIGGTVQIHHPDRESDFAFAQVGPGAFFGEMAQPDR